MSAQVTSSTHKGSPTVYLIFGIVVLFVLIVATLLQIQTSEAFVLGAPSSSLVPNWELVFQVPNYLQGHLSDVMAKAVVIAWGFELVYVITMVFHEVAHAAMRGTHPWLYKIFTAAPIAVIAFQFWSDFRYGDGLSFWGQLLFALIVSFIVLTGGVIAGRLIEAAIKGYRA